MLHKIWATCSILLLMLFSIAAANENISLTADNMQYDIAGGRFVADGNVVIKGRGLTMTAKYGEGSVENKTFKISGDISVNGIWEGDKVKLSADVASASMVNPIVYNLENGIKGEVGKILLDCANLKMSGDELTANGIRRLRDGKTGMTFVANSAKAKISNGEIVQIEANGNITFTGIPQGNNELVVIKGNKAIYSVARGTVTVSGKVSAVQKRRTLNAESVIYFPKTNRVEAVGKPRITINLEDEKIKK